jgi:glycolate oxidase FAD binding subunit
MTLPLTSTLTPATVDDLAAAVRSAYESQTPVYPLGGQTSLGYGLPAKASGLGLSTTALHRVTDYPARDMTITVEAGATLAIIGMLLATEKQQLPFDVPNPERATLGGVIATAWNSPRRYGLGSVRDYVIGISAVDGRGMPFKGGGRVVKNVAGYDFCKLLTGSCGVLGVITQLTLKVRPIPQASVLVAVSTNSAPTAERLLAALSDSQTTPSAIVVLSGDTGLKSPALAPLAAGHEGYLILVALEGTSLEVAWMQQQLSREWSELGQRLHVVQEKFLDEAGDSLWRQLIDWTAEEAAPLILKANVRPSGVTPLIEGARRLDASVSFLAHAGSGTVFLKFREFPASGLSRLLIGKLQPLVVSLGGQATIVSNPSGSEMTQQSAWGTLGGDVDLMRAVKRNFDPRGILNPGRFVV